MIDGIMSPLVITSPSNPRLRSLTGLRRRRVREDTGTTLLEGFEELQLALEAGVVPRTLYHCPELMLSPQHQLRAVADVEALGAETVELGRHAFEKVAYREGPDGFLAVVDQPGAHGCPDLGPGPTPLVLVCQGVEKPGNLGAMLRTADAAGAAALVAADPVTDWGNPNLVRASKGTVFSVPVGTDSTTEVVSWARRLGLRLVAATPDTDVEHTDVDYTGPVAIWVGAEKPGLTDDLLATADHRVRIPMTGRANSLNVATSAAIIVYEAVRQRRAAAGPVRQVAP